MQPKPLPNLAYLNTILDYNPDTGELRWKVKRASANIGDVAGYLSNNAYKKITINNIEYNYHRICYYMGTNINPNDKLVDHIDGNKTNNILSNLRIATHSQNSSNCKKYITNTTGHKGIQWRKNRNKWLVMLTINYKRITVGHFNTIEEAQKARYDAEIKHFKEYRRAK